MNPICLNTKEPSVRESLIDIYNLSEFASDEVFEEYGIKYNTNIRQATDRLERLGYISKKQAADIITLNVNFKDLSKDVQKEIKDAVTRHYFTFNDGTIVETPFELNSQQRDALNEINDFVNSKESTMTLAGYAGTGKTSLMELVAKGIRGNFVFTATTHAAAGVLNSRVRKLGFDAYTVHKAFGINVEVDKDQTSYDAKKLVNSIKDSKILRPRNIVVIDEASMINEAQYKVLLSLAEELNLKIIFVGDKAQLAPVGEAQISKVFRNNNGRIVELTQVERTGDNAILKEATALRDGQELSNESEFNSEGKGVAYIQPSNKQTIRDIINKFAPKLKDNPNYFRILAYRNARVAAYNQAVRNALGYDSSILRVGEPMMGYKNYGYNYGAYDLINSGSYTVEFVGKPTIRKYNLDGESIEFEVMPITLKNSLGGTHNFNYTDIRDNAQNRLNAVRLAEQKNKLWAIYKSSSDAKQRRKALDEINYIDEFLFVNDNVTEGKRTLVEKVIDFGYAMTVHKSQGSTFTNIILDEDDISSAKSEKFEDTNVTVADVRKQLEYVGVSRATDTVTIISSETKTEDTPLNHENTAQTKETTNPILEQYKKNIEYLSGYYEGGGAVLLDIIPNLPTELDSKLGDHFMGGKELTLDDYRKLWRYIKFDDKGQVIPTEEQEVGTQQKAFPVTKHQGNWSRKEAENNPNILYVFTDNTDRDSGSNEIPDDSWYAKKYGTGHHYPTMTAAVVRGLNNARPISTQRWYHQGAKGTTGRWTDANVEEFKSIIREELEEIVNEFNTGKYDTIMFPDGDGLFNTRISNITKERTPKLYQALADLLREYGFDSLIPNNIKSQDLYPNAETKINIYAGTGENSDLSNFAKRPFTIKGVQIGEGTNSDFLFPTVEHAFQAAKIFYADIDNREEWLEKIRTSKTSSQARSLGKQIPKLNSKEWDLYSSEIMKDLLKASFEQNPQALQRLLATGNATLTHTQDKGKWGTEFPRILMEVREELKKNQPTQEIHQSSFDISNAEFYSGAAEGSDKYWGEQARALGIKVKDYTTQSYKDLNQEWKDRIEQEYTEARAFLGKPKLTGKPGELTRRDMMQADKADAVFAIAEKIVKPGEKEISNGKEYTNNTNHDNVQGGTANAVARGIIRGIPVYVFDQSDNRWKVWDKNSNSFVETAMPILTTHAATIGTRGINEAGKQAIRNILNATINQLTNIESVSTETQQETTDAAELDEGFLNEVEEAANRKEESAKEADKIVINNYRAPVLEVTQQQIDDVNSKLSPEKQEVVSRFISKIFIRLVDSKLKEAQEQIDKKANDTKKPNESLDEAKNRVKAEIRRENKEYLRRLEIARDPLTRDEELEQELINKVIPLEQIDVIHRDSLQSLVDELREMIVEATTTASTLERKELLKIATDNFPYLFNMASTRINQVYGLNIFGDLSELDLEEDSEQKSSDTSENNIQDEETSPKEDFSKNGDHSKSSELSLSKEVRLLYEEIYQTYKNGQFIKDALNQKIPVDLSSAHAAISNQLRFMIDARDMVPLLMRMSQPWVKQLLNKLVVCDEKGNPILDNGVPTIKDDNLFNAFYSSYRLYFQPMTVMYKDKKTGQYKTRNLSVTENVQYLMNTVRRNIATSTLQGTAKHSIYKDGKINKTKDTIQDVIDLKDFIRELRKSFTRKEYKDIDSFFAAHGLESKLKNYLQNIGFEISSDVSILDEIKSSTRSSRESFTNYFNTLDNLLESIYNIYNLTINKAENENIDIVNNSRRDYVLVAQVLSGTVKGTVETSTNEDGKNIYSLGKPSYLSNMVQKIKQTVSDKNEGDADYYNAWVENTFGQFDFFKNQDTGEWRSDICEKLFGDNPKYREIFDHTRLLKIDKSDYTKWTERECNLALFNMYNSIKFNKDTGNEQQAWFRLFLFSDSPAGDFIKFVKYVDTEDTKYQDILIDKFWGLFNQERARMRNVKKRLDMQVNGEPLNLIAGYDATLNEDGSIKTTGGLVCRFLPGLNYLKVDESYITNKLAVLPENILGLSFIEALEKLETNANEWELTQDDIKDFFTEGFLRVFNSDFEKSYKSLFESGTIEVEDDGFVSGIVNSRGEKIKLYSDSTEKLKKGLTSLLKNKSLSSEDKNFLTHIQDKINNNSYVSEEELENAIDIFNSYVDANSQIEFEHSPLWLAWREYEMNFNFMTSQTLQLCTTDLTFYGKVNCKQSTKSDYDFAVTINGKNQYYKITADSTIKTLQKRFKELHAPSSKGNNLLGKYKQEYEKTVYLEDKEIKSLVYSEIEKVVKSNESLGSKDKEDILKAFREINVADAQAYRSISSYERILGQMGMLTDEMKIALQHIKENKFDRWDLGVVFQTLKPYVYTRVAKDSHAKTKGGKNYKISVPTQHKNSEFALMVIYAAIGQSLSNSPVLVGLHKFMEDNNVDVVQFESTTKVGLQGKLKESSFEDSDNVAEVLKSLCGITTDNPDGNPEVVHQIPMEDWGIQTATPEHIIDKRQLIGTQIRKLIMSDMPERAEFTLRMPNGDKVTKSKEEWIKIYNDIIHEQIFDAFSQIDDRFNPEKNPKGINGAGLEIQKLIHESIATSYKYDRDLIEACTWNGTGFNIPLSDRCMTEKIQEILNSIVKNRVTKQKIRGGACIQVSDYGFEYSDDLHIKFNADGSIDYIPCMMPLYSKDLYDKFVDDAGNVDIKRIQEEAPELLEAIGYRVPTEDMYSMAHLKIVGFTPIFNGSVIMLPSEITTIAGSDFDVDKLYLMLHDFKVEKYDRSRAFDDFYKQSVEINNLNTELHILRESFNSSFPKLSEKRFLKSEIANAYIDYEDYLEVRNQVKSTLEEPEKAIKEKYKEAIRLEFEKWYNRNCENYKLPPNEWKIIIPKYNYSKDAKEQSSAARNNGMIDMMYSVLQTPYAAKKILNPGGFDPQKRASRICNIIDNSSPERLMSITGTKSLRDAIQKIQELKVKELDALEDNLSKFDNPLSASTATRLHQQNMTGASQVGIYANYNVFHTLLQQCNVKIAGDFTINNNEALNKDNPNKLGNITNGRGKYISKISAGYLAASVDNGKDPLLKGLNSTPETANIIGFLSLCGYEPLEVGAFMTIPAVKQVFDIMRLQNVSFEQALSQVQKSFQKSLDDLKLPKDTYDSIAKDAEALSIDTMLLCKAYANDENLSENQNAFYIIANLEALYNLESINQHSQELSRILTVSRADTQNGGAGPLNIKNIDKEIRQAQVKDKQSRNVTKDGLNPFFKIYAFTTPNQSTFTKDFFKYGIESVRQLFGSFFMEYSSVGESIIGIISNEYGVPEKLARRAFDDWQKYNLMRTELFGQQDDVDVPTKMKYYVAQFPKEFIAWKEQLPDDIAQLTFVTNMELEEANDGEPYTHLKLTDLGKTSSARERVKLDWLKLYEYDADMATKLFVYGGLRGGFGFNPKSYLHLAPAQLRAKMPKYVETLNNPFSYSKFYEFWKQFCRNNWNEQSIVPRLKDNSKLSDIVRQSDGTITITIKGYKDDWEGIKIAPSVVIDDTKKEPVLYEIVSRVPLDTPDGPYTRAIYKPTTALGLGDLYREYNPNSVAMKSIFRKEDIKNAVLTTDDTPVSETKEESKLPSTKKSDNTLGTTTNKTTRTNEIKC